MTDKLPPNLLALFAPRPPLRWVPACDFPPHKRKTTDAGGVAQYLPDLEAYGREMTYHPTESWLEMRDRKKREHKAKLERLLTEGPINFNPSDDPNVRGDAFKTLIAARLSYETNESDLEREFGRYGPIERIRIIRDTHAGEKGNKKRKPHRGYAFVVFEREKDMRAALEGCDGIRIKDRRIKVDVERGRTVKGWKPRRLGGGLGGRHYTKAMPARPMGPGGFGGGFGGGSRGGFGGGFRGRDRGFRGAGSGFGGERGFGGGRDFQGGGVGYGGRNDRSFGDRGSERNFGPVNGSAPPAAPNGPGGYGGRDARRDFSGSGGGYGRDGGSRSYDDRSGGGYRDRNSQQSGSNMEPIRPREPREFRDDRDSRDVRDRHGGGYHGGRDYERAREDDSRKRSYEGGYEDSRKLRRY